MSEIGECKEDMMRAAAEWANFRNASTLCASTLALALALGLTPARAQQAPSSLRAALMERLDRAHPTRDRAAVSEIGARADMRVALAGTASGAARLKDEAADGPDDDDAGTDLDPVVTVPPPELDAEPDAAVAPEVSAPPSATGQEASAEQLLPRPNAALKAALETRSVAGFKGSLGPLNRREREAVAAFYAARGFAPLWSSDGKPNIEVEPVMERLARAAEDGLDIRSTPTNPAQANSEEALVAADIALTDAVVAYGRQASGSRIDPHSISPLIGAKPEVADVSVILAIVATAGDQAGAALRGFNPAQKGYEALRDKLAELRHERVPSAARAPRGPAPAIKIGGREPRAALERARLSPEARQSGAFEDIAYETGTIDSGPSGGRSGSRLQSGRTAAAPPPRLEAEIIANMERWRWMPRDLGDSRIEVNIPDFEVTVIENGRVVHRNRVVVGKEQTPTPIFSNQMKFLIVNPAWNVPPSIIRKEMMPRLASDPGYLRRLGYQVAYVGGRLTVRQPPGERNALGRIKFMFPNDYSVYLHDTPSRALFSEARRAFSHGCVRVDDPFSFAESVLGRANGWSEQRIKGLIGGRERYVYLPKPLPVHIEYFTTYVDDSGRLQSRDDIYGYSHRVKAALGLES
ncbi:L,D-transpeptidase family protein [Methylocapsa acidiphila]|uniref:L,D-transpeptidase family protein n=1 Tax=Methylocapsa acidiphila TaxID=133552 RepID=UPI001FDA7774|nr:L,D-transpeptidase family protein [Methylocapsa acidiphila]